MRQIKFRAWDRYAKMMTDEGNLPTGPHMKYDVGLIPSDAPHNYTYGIDGLHVKAVNESFILMQFTGLLDKNGKEIYEGDVDKQGRHIEYRDGAFHVVQSNGQTFDYLSHMKHIEIIGNIYENPDLLK